VIVDSAREELDWPRLVAAAARREMTLTTWRSLAVVREVLGAPIPDLVMAELRALPSTRRERFLHRVAHGPAPAARLARRVAGR
jgi:hypothetical protein